MIHGSGPNHIRSEFNPDELPVITEEARLQRMRDINWSQLPLSYTTYEASVERMNEKFVMHKPGLLAMSQAVVGTNYSKFTRHEFGMSFVTAIGIDSGKDTVESVKPTMESIRNGCLELGRQCLVSVLINFSGDARREQKKLRERQQASLDMATELLAMFPSNEKNGPLLTVACFNKPAHYTISALRQNETHLAADRAIRHGAWQNTNLSLYKLPLHFIDADTTFGPEAIAEVYESAVAGRSIFTSGRMHYVGGVMDMPLAQVAQQRTHKRMLYVAETLRRYMIHGLPSAEFKSYTPEAFMCLRQGVLWNLNGFNTDESDNESYWVQMAAKEAYGDRFDPQRYKLFNSRGKRRMMPEDMAENKPFLGVNEALNTRYMTHYGNAIIKTSIDGIEHMVDTEGAYSLVNYDQGGDYVQRTMRSFADNTAKPYTGPELAPEEQLMLLDAVYAYFRSVGLRLDASHVRPLNHVIKELFDPYSDQKIVWLPPPDEELPNKIIDLELRQIVASH